MFGFISYPISVEAYVKQVLQNQREVSAVQPLTVYNRKIFTVDQETCRYM